MLRTTRRYIGDEGVCALASALRASTCPLRSLSVSEHMSDAAFGAMLSALMCTRCLARRGLRSFGGPRRLCRVVEANVAFSTRCRWAVLKAACRFLAVHARAVRSANHPQRLLLRGEFELNIRQEDDGLFGAASVWSSTDDGVQQTKPVEKK